MSRKVVITGRGLVTPLGNGLANNLQALKEGRSGIVFMQEWADIHLDSLVAGAADREVECPMFNAKNLRFMSPNSRYAVAATYEALQDAGFKGTQATISRDIKELRIVKELTSLGSYRYTTSANELNNTFSNRLNTIFRECVVGVDYAQNIIVIRTLPGLASAAGSAIDAMNMHLIVGCLAGDDTVMVVMRDNNAAAAFCGEIKNLINR